MSTVRKINYIYIIHLIFIGGMCSFKLYVYNDVMNHILPIIIIINLPLTL